jgi:hypothetical protein
MIAPRARSELATRDLKRPRERDLATRLVRSVEKGAPSSLLSELLA